MRRSIVSLLLLVCLGAAGAPAAAVAQSNPFGPLPPAEPAPTVVPPEDVGGQDEISRGALFGIAGGVAVIFVAIGVFITRDARRNLTDHDREALERTERTELERRRGKVVKSKARAKGKAQRQARKAHRRR